LISLGAKPTDVPSLDPTPAWTSPDLGTSELWPIPDDRDVDLNATDGPRWIDEAGRVARSQLAVSTLPLVVGHGDWHTGNLRWKGANLHTVWDWDSAIAASEPAIAGLAAAVYPGNGVGSEATVQESEAFLDAYQAERGSSFSDVELKEAWAAGLWNRSFDAKKQSATEGGPKSLTRAEALERQRRILEQ
jgi:Ser/Thr protein kinase RdoA (MazF antagonist)